MHPSSGTDIPEGACVLARHLRVPRTFCTTTCNISVGVQGKPTLSGAHRSVSDGARGASRKGPVRRTQGCRTRWHSLRDVGACTKVRRLVLGGEHQSAVGNRRRAVVRRPRVDGGSRPIAGEIAAIRRFQTPPPNCPAERRRSVRGSCSQDSSLAAKISIHARWVSRRATALQSSCYASVF